MVDAGDFFGPKSPARERDKGKFVTRVMEVASYDAVGIGEAELRYGLGFLRAQLEASNLPAVSANLVYADSGEPVVSSYLMLKRGGLRIGVTAVSGELEALRGKEDLNAWRDQNVTLTDPKTALESVVKRMREQEKADLVIVLAHMGYEEAERMGGEVPGIDVWVEVHNRGRMITPERKEGSETIYAACRGRSSGYGELYLSIDENRRVGSFVGQARTLPSKGASDETVAAMIADFKRQEQKPVAARAKKAQRPHFDAKMVGRRTYVGVESCKKCHQKAYESWADTPHAAAYATIAETDQWNDPDCLLCHTTGYGEMSDVETGMIEPRFWNVQCESCHGMGTGHSRSPGAAAVAEHVCTDCHNQSNSPDFDYEAYLGHVVH